MAKKRRKPGVVTDPSPLEVLAHPSDMDREFYEEERDFIFELTGEPSPNGVLVSSQARYLLQLSRMAVRYEPELWASIATDAMATMVVMLEVVTFHHQGKPWPRYTLPGVGDVEIRVSSSNLMERDARTWLMAYGLARLRGDQVAIDRLTGVDFDALYSSRTYNVALSEALVALETQMLGTVEAHLQRAEEAIAERIRKTLGDHKMNKHVVHLTQPLVAVVRTLTAGDGAAFNEALAEAFRHHREYWNQSYALNRGDTKLMDQPAGWSSYVLGGLAQTATARGLDVKVRSEYAPSWFSAKPLP